MAPALRKARTRARTNRACDDGRRPDRIAVAARAGPDRPTDRMAVGAAGACRAQPVTGEASPRRSFACWPRCSDQIAMPRQSRCPIRPLHEMYAVPAGSLHQGARRRRANRSAGAHRHRWSARARESTCAATRRRSADVIAAVPWFGMRTLFAGTPPPARRGLVCSRRRGDGVQDDRDREPLVRPAGHGRDVRRACRAGPCSGCSTSGWRSAARRPTCRSLRAAPTRWRRKTRTTLIAAAAREVAEALPGARARARQRHGHPREARDVLARRRPAGAARDVDAARRACGLPATGSTPGCRERSKAQSSAATGGARNSEC